MKATPPSPKDLSPMALFLDIDGTLLEFAPTPEQVVVTQPLKNLLHETRQHLSDAMALVSGREMSSIDGLFDWRGFPAAGQHGLELRHQDTNQLAMPFPQALSDRLAAAAAELDGVRLEFKGGTCAIHYRKVPHLASEVLALGQTILDSIGGDYELIAGNHVVELKPSGINKGTAIGAFMLEPPFHGRRPIFIGDDTTDGPGFVVVNRLGGVSIVVGDKDLPADFRLPNVDAVRHWLQQIVE